MSSFAALIKHFVPSDRFEHIYAMKCCGDVALEKRKSYLIKFIKVCLPRISL